MDHTYVKRFLVLVIVVNALTIGVESDHNNSDATKSIFLVVESVRLIFPFYAVSSNM